MVSSKSSKDLRSPKTGARSIIAIIVTRGEHNRLLGCSRTAYILPHAYTQTHGSFLCTTFRRAPLAEEKEREAANYKALFAKKAWYEPGTYSQVTVPR